jgi:hypothetical protein
MYDERDPVDQLLSTAGMLLGVAAIVLIILFALVEV